MPHAAATAATMRRPRPCSAVRSASCGSGVPVPASMTSMRKVASVSESRIRHDESACVIALVASSLVTRTASARICSALPVGDLLRDEPARRRHAGQLVGEVDRGLGRGGWPSASRRSTR